VLDFDRKAVLPHLWIDEHLVERIDRRGRNVLLEQTAEPVLPASAAENRLQLLD
jgi:hypothetical protein